MKPAFEIDPELRGLEELVADPRSSLRLVPKKPLRYWIDSNEAVRPREISATKLKRHLIEAHREELALLLQTASLISYWKAPVLTIWPPDENGKPYDPLALEPGWRLQVRRLDSTGGLNHPLLLLGGSDQGIEAGSAYELARASLMLVPSDKTRCYLGLATPWTKPRLSLFIFERVLARTQSDSPRPAILTCVGRALCALRLFDSARDAYRAVGEGFLPSLVNAFNLSCFLGDVQGAVSDLKRTRAALGTGTEGLRENVSLLCAWAKEQPISLRATAQRTADDVDHLMPLELSSLAAAYAS
jgi:hypothetical protein